MPNLTPQVKKMTPLMEQYWGVKSAHPDKIVFFRMGDFFEIFHKDAEISAPILGIALTYRNKKSGDDTRMCGMPHHSIAGAVNKLLKQGFKVALCDQIEDPKEAKGLVKRGITRILSPGMVFDPDSLEADQSNYLACYFDRVLCFLECTTGEFFYYDMVNEKERDRILALLVPSELVLSESEYARALESKKSVSGPHLSYFTEAKSSQDGLGIYTAMYSLRSMPMAATRLLSYAKNMQSEELLKGIRKLEKRLYKKNMLLRAETLKHLEVFSANDGEATNSLFQKINRCKTSTGSRLLKRYLAFPLMDEKEIASRFDVVDSLIESEARNQESSLSLLRDKLSEMGDPERRLAKVSGPACNPKDMVTLKESLEAGLHITSLFQSFGFCSESVVSVADIVDQITQTIIEDAPVSLTKSSYIKKGFDKQLDEYFDLSENAQSLLNAMETREREKLGVSTLKIRYNSVFGYYLEVTKANSHKVPESYQRKQTLTNAERYTNVELKELETKVLSAKAKKDQLELSIFRELKSRIMAVAPSILALVDHWSRLDVLAAFAHLAMERNLVRPIFENRKTLDLRENKHPVLQIEMGESFVANDIKIAPGEVLLITGPNMAGKSTIMRQLALTGILAQIGCFVPAREARLPIFDQVFTRIGASDALSEGKSTFMVEMTEAAYILENATENSLVIFDEIGRGTSTYDGLSLAQAILEHLVCKTKAYVMFSTHYHELTKLSGDFSQLKNYHMSIRDTGNGPEFRHRFVAGAASKSYGVHVARLAGLPLSVTQRADKLLSELESEAHLQMSLVDVSPDISQELPNCEHEPTIDARHPLIDELKALSISEMTPLEIMNRIAQWQKELS